MEKFLKSSLFKFIGDEDGELLDWKLLSFFALFTCKQGTSSAIHRIAKRIARETKSHEKFMDKVAFQKLVKMIMQMASVNFIMAVVEAGYMEDLYQSSHYEQLESAIETISQDLTQKVFGEIMAVQVDEWMKMAHSAEYAWLFSFLTIREKVFTLSDVDKLHCNEKEAERLFRRLKRQQQLLKEKAMKEEMEGQQKEQLLLNYM